MSRIDGTRTDQAATHWTALAGELTALQRAGRWLPGPATTLEVIGRSEVELDHERLIAWLLDPRAAHRLGPAVLAAVLRRCGVPEPPDAGPLFRARVRTQVVRASSRPDIVVTLPDRTLVVELKINAPEGDGQTTRQADDHAGLPQPVLVFLTRRGDQPADGRFKALGLVALAEDLRQALADAPQPPPGAAARGRAVAHDYLATLERMLGLEPVDQDAARFWLAHGAELRPARQAARQLLARLPQPTAAALRALAGELGGDLVVTSFEYVAKGTKEHDEVAVLLSRRQWLAPDGAVRFGLGLGQRVAPDPDSSEQRPFWGVYVTDPAAFTALRTTWGGRKPWHHWVWWDHLDLAPPLDDRDLLTHYAERVAEQVRRAWPQDLAALDRAATAAEHPPAEH
ncbi:hypothetical protein [Kitasatospora sp. LaBMicrA B282]|uniref:hypothetical protein n=1 Tax=Kitasatospora sp. LaBMicrA B282 TaxID=3420949 RepID=UPI003D0CBA57